MKVLFNALLLCSLLVLGCANQKDSASPTDAYASKAEVKAPDTVASAFQVQKVETPRQTFSSDMPIKAIDKARVSIHSSSLEKEFLLSSNILTQSPVPMFENMKSRIVAFKKVGNQLFLLEATDGHIVREDIPANLLLAEFPILEEKDDLITFDFNKGMSRLFVMGGWHASDYGSPAFEQHFQAAPVRLSYIEEATLDDNRLFIRQIAQIAMQAQLTPLEVRYYLEPYRPNADFTPTRGTNFDRMGFFEIAPRFNEFGTQDIYATKFDHKKPITFAISANTPEEYQSAVRDGILYWNKAFGSEVIKSVVAPAGVSAPHPDYNIIQWVNWDTAGFAYADAQSDPRTGEVKNAQVIFTSVFAISGKRRARRLLDALKNATGERKLIALKGFAKTPLCHREADNHMAESLANLLEDADDDKKILEISADYIREVVAHEVGHTLGLRHNFAGSLAMSYGPDQRQDIINKYVSELKVDNNLVASSSTMEYNVFEEGAFIGNQMRVAETKALSYDDAAIKALYLGKEYKNSELPLFCTDSHVRLFADCERFDLFSSRTGELKHSEASALKTLPRRVFEAFIAARDPRQGNQKVKLAEVSLSPNGAVNSLIGKRPLLLSLLTDTFNLLSVHRAYDVVDDLNYEKVRKTQSSTVEADVLSAMGLENLLLPMPADFAATEFARFEALAKLEENRKGMGPGGNGYEFSDEDLEVILARTKAFYDRLEEVLEAAILTQLSATVKIDETPLADELASLLEARTEHYVMSVTGEKINGSVKDNEKTILLELPVFTYDFKLRKLAAGLLRNGRAKGLDWGMVENHQLKTAFSELLNEGLGGKKFTELKPVELSREVRQWVLENKKIKSPLDGRTK